MTRLTHSSERTWVGPGVLALGQPEGEGQLEEQHGRWPLLLLAPVLVLPVVPIIVVVAVKLVHPAQEAVEVLLPGTEQQEITKPFLMT